MYTIARNAAVGAVCKRREMVLGVEEDIAVAGDPESQIIEKQGLDRMFGAAEITS